MTTLAAKTIAFLTWAHCESILAYLADADTSCEQGELAMRWLLENKPSKAHEALCALYDVAYYHVGTSCFSDCAPACDQDKWFVATLANSGLDASAIPLADTAAQACEFAVVHLALSDSFFSGYANRAATPPEASVTWRCVEDSEESFGF